MVNSYNEINIITDKHYEEVSKFNSEIRKNDFYIKNYPEHIKHFLDLSKTNKKTDIAFDRMKKFCPKETAEEEEEYCKIWTRYYKFRMIYLKEKNYFLDLFRSKIVNNKLYDTLKKADILLDGLLSNNKMIKKAYERQQDVFVSVVKSEKTLFKFNIMKSRGRLDRIPEYLILKKKYADLWHKSNEIRNILLDLWFVF